MSCFSGQRVACRRGERQVFDGLDFRIEDGGCLMLTGPNGAGKTSLIRLMAGLARPAAGTIAWDGKPIDEAPQAHAARLAYVGHLDAVKSAFSVAENLATWAGFRCRPPLPIDRALAAFGLQRMADMPARLLSAGQRRRLALARLTALPARLWLLDEPTVALDADGVAAILAAIADHRAAGGMVAMSTNVAVGVPGAETLRLAGAGAGAG